MKTGVLFLVLSAVVEAASWRADLVEARQLQASGQAAKAESIYAHMIGEAKGLAPPELNSMALDLFYAARYREAEVIYHLALDGWDRMGQTAVRDRIITAANLGTLLRAEGRFAEAESILQECLRQSEALAGKDSLEWARPASGLAALYLMSGELPKAEMLALQAKTIFEHNANASESEGLNNLSILGSVYVEETRYDEADPLLKAILRGTDSRLATRAYNELAVAALRRDQLPEAEALALQALASERQSANSGGPLEAAILNNLADINVRQKRYVEAEQHYREAIAIWEGSVGKQHPDTAKAYMNLASFYHLRGREAGAEELYRRAIQVLEPAFGTHHVLVLVARNELADVLRAEGRYTESQRLGHASLTGLEEKLSPGDPRVLHALANEARLFASTHRTAEAAALRDRIEQMGQSFRVNQ
jgi:tetratricopeptide (TPR) repeat protein